MRLFLRSFYLPHAPQSRAARPCKRLWRMELLLTLWQIINSDEMLVPDRVDHFCVHFPSVHQCIFAQQHTKPKPPFLLPFLIDQTKPWMHTYNLFRKNIDIFPPEAATACSFFVGLPPILPFLPSLCSFFHSPIFFFSFTILLTCAL
ncbi:hypothetical protein BX070DRAFT_26387 [Coemansia spiralis]|nr:hypothetical protein BX070DRAFT_26387 [Coemansia spiralis]